ncbi:MEMBRANE-ASSOCIATED PROGESTERONE RECEPTOR COMPONENT-RELATED [Salix viminalis]|uniref:MEMBRANE-ASSOCIATED PROGESTERONE RECEPTOR COMPONENT-RELATED n=1 Tax=Salix viminalis TaxID=40686 RepID=A0A9Q0Z4W2_SALVM|nr:MEMBRANE-ASSOCIATED PROGESTERONE RECEPTOR COMPONENT-RELATED [Salix viminalis]
MGSGKEAMASSSQNMDISIAGLRERHQQELENLTLTGQPLKTLKFFVLAMVQYCKRSVFYLLAKGGWLMLLSTVIAAVGIVLVTIDGPHEKHVEELSNYLQFGLWWIALGVASSIGLGSGLHTFVLYLGPHIALFTIKAMQCGRVDLKSAPYDTIQLKRGPSWIGKDCQEFGDPVFPFSHGLRVPLSSILFQVQIEAILWGVGTALGELPPYFISRAGVTIYPNVINSDLNRWVLFGSLLYLTARISGSKLDAMEELDASLDENSGIIATRLTAIKHWLLTHSQHLNFFTILVLASVPNPLFDLAGIMCGQFGVPFWKFFAATLIGKAIVKTHIQTIFIISVCNNQLLNWIENELIWVLSLIPGFAPALPDLTAKLHAMKEKYMAPAPLASSDLKVKNWNFSFAGMWNTVVWLMLLNFFLKIVNSTAQSFLKKQQEKDLASLTNGASALTHSD